MLLFLVLSVQSVFAVDVPLKDANNPNAGTNPRLATRAVVIVPVSVDVSSSDISIFFSQPVGVATVTITDEFGNVVYDDAIDTEYDTEMYIPTDYFDGGTYTLTITYGTKILVGEFTL